MDGIILLNKEKGITSRDLVNKVSKKLNMKKVGHAGTLDPLAEGLMVIGIGKGTKILDLLSLNKKEYIATIKMGFQTDTYDITGNIISKKDNFKIDNSKIEEVIYSFKGSYFQTVPKYSAVKINGKKLYEYARNNQSIELPKRKVNIYNIEIIKIDNLNNEIKIKTLVSKGTYIRSLINDIGEKLDIPCTMKELIRTKSGKFDLQDSSSIDSDFKIISIKDSLDFKIIEVGNETLLKRIKNGNQIDLKNEMDLYVILTDINEKELAIYKKDNSCYKAYKMF